MGTAVLRRVAILVALGAVSGCALSSGGPTERQLAARAPQTGYTICTGAYASRFTAREAVGRVCRRSTSLDVL